MKQYVKKWILMIFLFDIFFQDESHLIDLGIIFDHLLLKSTYINILESLCDIYELFLQYSKIISDVLQLFGVIFFKILDIVFTISYSFLQSWNSCLAILELFELFEFVDIVSMVWEMECLFDLADFADQSIFLAGIDWTDIDCWFFMFRTLAIITILLIFLAHVREMADSVSICYKWFKYVLNLY